VPGYRIKQHSGHKSDAMVSRYIREADKWTKSGLRSRFLTFRIGVYASGSNPTTGWWTSAQPCCASCNLRSGLRRAIKPRLPTNHGPRWSPSLMEEEAEHANRRRITERTEFN
jgi:hypothetical protein